MVFMRKSRVMLGFFVVANAVFTLTRFLIFFQRMLYLPNRFEFGIFFIRIFQLVVVTPSPPKQKFADVELAERQ